MGQIALRDVAEIGDAVLRLRNWFTNLGEAGIDALARFTAELDERDAEVCGLSGPPRGLVAWPPLNRVSGVDSNGRTYWLWGCSLQHDDEEERQRAGGAGWRITVGRSLPPPTSPEVERSRVAMGVSPDGLRLAAAIWLRHGEVVCSVGGLEAFPMLDMVRRRTGAERETMRNMVRGALAFGSVAPIAVDPAWTDEHQRESAMAQVCQWLLQPGLFREESSLSGDALAWFEKWASRAAHRPVDSGELYEFVRRVIPPTSPGAHRRFYRNSLHQGRPMVLEAARQAGISERQAYRRLEATHRTPDEFDSAESLFAHLRASAPAESAVSQDIVDYLVSERLAAHPEADRTRVMEWARKLERRTRQLPPAQRLERIMNALAAFQAPPP